MADLSLVVAVAHAVLRATGKAAQKASSSTSAPIQQAAAQESPSKPREVVDIPHAPAPEGAAEAAEIVSSSGANEDSRPVRVFVSWAHANEDWSAQEASHWERRVVEFTTILRSFGIDADIDLYHASDPSIDWTRFGQRGVESADFVIIVNSKGWAERWAGTNNPTLGTGAVVEADTLKGRLQGDQDEFQRRTLMVKLPGPGNARIPLDLNRLNRFTIDPEDADSFEGLLRVLTGQPVYHIPALGKVPTLPSSVSRDIGVKKKPTTTQAYADYEAVRDEIEKALREQDPSSDVRRRLATLMGILDALQQ